MIAAAAAFHRVGHEKLVRGPPTRLPLMHASLERGRSCAYLPVSVSRIREVRMMLSPALSWFKRVMSYQTCRHEVACYCQVKPHNHT